MFKLIFISFSFKRGGAGIAASKFKNLLTGNPSSFSPSVLSQDEAGRFQFSKRIVSFALSKLQFDGNPIKHSLNLFSYPPVIKKFKAEPESLYHLHWFNNDTLSVFDLDKIPAGSMITLHDEWIYCGAEHCYKVLDDTDCFQHGYSFFKKGVYGLHWNYIIWRIKQLKLSHRSDLIYTVPSRWMLARAQASLILKNADVRYLPNPIDTGLFNLASVDKITEFRNRYSFEGADIVFAYGAVGGRKNFLKGHHHLDEALGILRRYISPSLAGKVKFVEFGGEPSKTTVHGFDCVSVGHIKDPVELSLLYASVDCVVVPSMVESFGQVAAEALACGTPVVSFDTSGLKDIVLHEQTGLVAEAFSPESFAQNMLKIIEMAPEKRKALGLNGRAHVESTFSFPVVSQQYLEIIKDAVELKKSSHV
ncbi:glycosyltransferase [Thiomicrospira microaerophila]|uniref:glycosyltransferase n=1 Tax=Thiomicrospira microaerophila TaxID=406020 RepID=UPI0005C9BEF6|nr:glycosyltransferase [Thiomicrospira microaerophila]